MGARPRASGGSDWARLFAETPNYRGLGKAVLGREKFRWHFGPMFYRGRLTDGDVRVLVIGQEGAQDESLGHRSFVGGTGARMQHFLHHIGITRSYLFLNTFVYPINGQYDGAKLRWLAQSPDSPIVQHRHAILDHVLARNDLRLVVAVGVAAKETVVTWVKAHGGSARRGAEDVSRCDGSGPPAEGADRRRAAPRRGRQGGLDGRDHRGLQEGHRPDRGLGLGRRLVASAGPRGPAPAGRRPTSTGARPSRCATCRTGFPGASARAAPRATGRTASARSRCSRRRGSTGPR